MSFESSHTSSPQEKITESEFQSQFIEQSLQLNGAECVFVSIEPNEKISNQTVLFIGGFGAGAKEYFAEIQEIAKSGRKVLFLNPLQGISPNEADGSIMNEFAIPDTIQHKTAEVIAALEAFNLERVDMVCHSQGAVIGATLSLLRPGLAEDLALLNPAGMHGADTSAALVGRTVLGLAEQQIQNVRGVLKRGGDERSRVFDAVGSVAKGTQILKKPLWRFQQEIPGIIDSNIIPVLQQIRARQQLLEEGMHTKITLVTANKDRTFSPQKIEQNLAELSPDTATVEDFFGEAIDSYAMYIDKNAGHEEVIYGAPGLSAQIVNEKLQK
jgi:pimeloyl-ACP methyl ester carboxylesterase